MGRAEGLLLRYVGWAVPYRFRHHFPRWYWTQEELDDVKREAAKMAAWFRSMDNEPSGGE